MSENFEKKVCKENININLKSSKKNECTMNALSINKLEFYLFKISFKKNFVEKKR